MKCKRRYVKISNKVNNRLERGRIMKLKTRLITAFFVIACVPLILPCSPSPVSAIYRLMR